MLGTCFKVRGGATRFSDAQWTRSLLASKAAAGTTGGKNSEDRKVREAEIMRRSLGFVDGLPIGGYDVPVEETLQSYVL